MKLETKPDANLKDIYMTVRQHLLAQGRRSERVYKDGSASCLYRHPSGDRCAIGCLIPDDAYSADIENAAVDCAHVQDCLPFSVDDHVIAFLDELQLIHDYADVEHWADELERLARRYGIISQ